MVDAQPGKRRLADLDFGFAQRAVESLGTTIGDLSKRHEYELDDAIDAHITKPLSPGEHFGLVAGIKESLWQLGAKFAEGDRFGSYEEMAQWVVEAAKTRGFVTTEKTFESGGKWLYVTVPGGKVFFSNGEGTGYTCGSGADSDEDAPAIARLGRELLRAGQALQNDA